MRKNHHGKKDRLVKRVFALCLALAVICTCLVPVFATEDLSDLQVEKELPGTSEEEAAGFGDDFPAVDDGEPREVYDEGEAAGFGGDEVATRPVEGGEDNPGEGGTVKETEWGTVIEYGPSSSTGTDPEPETQWSGEDDVVEKPDDKVVVSGDEIKKLQDMVVYRFWLKELNANDLQDITAQAQINNMTESEYLARNGEVLWNLYFIQAVPRVETIADYSSYIENPSSNRDPKGELRQFDYWYTLDEFGNRVHLNLTDPTSNILDDKTTTVNVYAAWKDGTVGSDEEESVDHEDLVDKNPVPVDLETKAAASYKDEDGNTKSVNLPVEVKNLPSAADHLSVSHMGDNSMEEFCNTYVNELQGMQPLLGLKISPKNANGEKVQLAEGEKATVTVSGLDKLPEIAAMEEEGALTADALKVLHQKDDNTVEKLDVVSYENGTLTFETSSFSPFVLALTGGYDAELLDERASYAAENKNYTVQVGGQPIEIQGRSSVFYSDHSWSSSNSSVATVTFNGSKAKVTGVNIGEVTITHNYKNGLGKPKSEEFAVRVIKKLKSGEEEAEVYFLHDMTKNANENGTTHWRGPVLVNGSNAVVNTTDAIWEGGVEGTTVYENRNIKQNVSNYIVNWPDLKTGTTWKLDKTVRTQQVDGGTIEDVVYKNFLSQLKEAGMTDAQLAEITAKDIDITLVPYKISQRNNTDPDKHIDCNIVITCNSAYTAKFNVKLPTDTVYETRSTKIYLNDEKVLKCNGDSEDNIKKYAPESITDSNGVKWDFDGWYPENDAGTGPDLNATPIQGDSWPYTVRDYQLTNYGGDRVVNFYAHYKKATSNVTITKQVTGLLGDTNKEFAFSVSITQNGTACTGVTAKKGDQMVSLTDFTLKHNETVTLENVPIGATITVNESTPGEHYTVYSTGYNDGQNGSGEVTFKYVAVANTAAASDTDEADLMLLSMDEGTAVDTDAVALADATDKMVTNNAIMVTNHCTLFPDTGVLLDTLPYIVILAVVAGGVALLMLRKHRKEDD